MDYDKSEILDIIEIEPLDDEIDLDEFDCAIASVNKLLQDAYYKQVMKLASSNKIIINNRIVGYFIIGMAEIESEDNIYWAINLEVIAIAKEYQDKFIGTNVIKYLIERALDISNFIGCRYFVLDAIKERAAWYESRGFSFFNKDDMNDNNSTVKMYIDFQDESLVNDYFEL